MKNLSHYLNQYDPSTPSKLKDFLINTAWILGTGLVVAGIFWAFYLGATQWK